MRSIQHAGHGLGVRALPACGQDEFSAAVHHFARAVRRRLGQPQLTTDHAVRHYGSYGMRTGGNLYAPHEVLVRGNGDGPSSYVRVRVNPNNPKWREELMVTLARASEKMIWVLPAHKDQAVPQHTVQSIRWADGSTLEESVTAHHNCHARALHHHHRRGAARPVYGKAQTQRPAEGDTIWNRLPRARAQQQQQQQQQQQHRQHRQPELIWDSQAKAKGMQQEYQRLMRPKPVQPRTRPPRRAHLSFGAPRVATLPTGTQPKPKAAQPTAKAVQKASKADAPRLLPRKTPADVGAGRSSTARRRRAKKSTAPSPAAPVAGKASPQFVPFDSGAAAIGCGHPKPLTLQAASSSESADGSESSAYSYYSYSDEERDGSSSSSSSSDEFVQARFIPDAV
jgi:hypothetical protein